MNQGSCLTGTGRETGVGVTWEYMFIGTGIKTGTGMGTGMYSLFTPSSTSVDTDMKNLNIIISETECILKCQEVIKGKRRKFC